MTDKIREKLVAIQAWHEGAGPEHPEAFKGEPFEPVGFLLNRVAELERVIAEHSAEWEAICNENHRADVLERERDELKLLRGEVISALQTDRQLLTKERDTLRDDCARYRAALELLRATPAKRMQHLENIGAKIGRAYGTETCVDNYWRKLIIEEALSTPRRAQACHEDAQETEVQGFWNMLDDENEDARGFYLKVWPPITIYNGQKLREITRRHSTQESSK
jgi:hypothetical protein